jgi:hypothetical protein
MQRWNPFRDLREMEGTVNRLWRGFGVGPAYAVGNEEWNLLMDVIQKGDDFVVKASMPGIKPKPSTLTGGQRPDDKSGEKAETGGEAVYLIQSDDRFVLPGAATSRYGRRQQDPVRLRKRRSDDRPAQGGREKKEADRDQGGRRYENSRSEKVIAPAEGTVSALARPTAGLRF